MSVEIAVIAGSSVAGAVSAALLGRLSKTKSRSNERPAQKSVNAVKTELVSLLFEKTLASEAITRVYEASQQGRIDRLERDRLLLKYKQQLDSMNQKITQLQPAADFAELTELRQDLATILEEKIASLDQKLEQLSKSGIPYDSSVDTKVQQIIAETTRIQPTAAVDRKPKSNEKSVEQLQDEIVEALDRLEQVELDKD